MTEEYDQFLNDLGGKKHHPYETDLTLGSFNEFYKIDAEAQYEKLK